MSNTQTSKSNIFSVLAMFYRELTSSKGVEIDQNMAKKVEKLQEIQKSQGSVTESLSKTVGLAHIPLDKQKGIQHVRVDVEKAKDAVQNSKDIVKDENELNRD